MGLTSFVMAVNPQALAVTEPAPQPIIFTVQATTTLSNKYVDITFDRGVYADAGRVNPVTAANFSIVNFTAGGTTVIAIASVKRNTHHVAATALALIGGEETIRIFLTLTGTPNSTESFQIRCNDVYDGSGIMSEPVTSSIINLTITPLMLWDYLESSAVVTTGLGVSTLDDIIGTVDVTQTTDSLRPIDGGEKIAFNGSSQFLTGGDVGALDFQKGNSFTVVIHNLQSLNSGTTGWIIANRGISSPLNNRGWSISVGTDNSLFFVMHDNTSQGFADYDAFTPSSVVTLFFVNSNGTLTIYDNAGNILGTQGNATGIAAIDYTNVTFFMGRRGVSTSSYFRGYWEKIGIFNSALTIPQQAKVIANL